MTRVLLCASSSFLPARLTHQRPLSLYAVGDAYMACGGLFAQDPSSPVSPSSTDAVHGHAHAALLFALLSQSAASQSGVQLRIGIQCVVSRQLRGGQRVLSSLGSMLTHTPSQHGARHLGAHRRGAGALLPLRCEHTTFFFNYLCFILNRSAFVPPPR